MQLQKMYSFLVQQPKNRVCRYGFTKPHSHNGHPDQLAFEFAENVTIEHMLECCNRAVSEVFEDWQGNQHTYTKNSTIFIIYTDFILAPKHSFPSEILMSIANLD